MSVSRVARERREREPETAPRSRSDKRQSITVDKTDYVNMLSALHDARELSRDLWHQLKHFENICQKSNTELFRKTFGCDAAVIVTGFREEHEKIGHVLQRGLKGKAHVKVV